MTSRTWHAADEVSNEVRKVQAHFLQQLRFFVDVALQILARIVDVVHKRLRQTAALRVHNARNAGKNTER